MFEDTKTVLSKEEQEEILSLEEQKHSLELDGDSAVEYFFVEEKQKEREKIWKKAYKSRSLDVW